MWERYDTNVVSEMRNSLIKSKVRARERESRKGRERRKLGRFCRLCISKQRGMQSY